jgi:hypothetical protein
VIHASHHHYIQTIDEKEGRNVKGRKKRRNERRM